MKKKLILISSGLFGILSIAAIAVLGMAAMKPDIFKVERSISINAPASEIYPLINDLHNWSEWSPWEEKDPGMKRSLSGPEAGKGAVYAWSGNDDVGEGSMTIVDSEEPERIDILLSFKKPFEGDNKVVFTLRQKETEEKPSTDLTWSMEGENPFLCKVIQIFIDVDKMCGADFEKGLSKLKKLSENK
ncbi:MAG: SRPBCC family protein [Cyanobacteriota/Melainabacteria group bacterium]